VVVPMQMAATAISTLMVLEGAPLGEAALVETTVDYFLLVLAVELVEILGLRCGTIKWH